jgi:hypothetical protein
VLENGIGKHSSFVWVLEVVVCLFNFGLPPLLSMFTNTALAVEEEQNE